MTEIHQFLPSLVPGDAIGNHTVQMQRILRGLGVASDIFYGDVARGSTVPASPYRVFDKRRRTGDGPVWLLYHASTGSPMAEWFRDRPERKLIDYHNITPSGIFGPWEPHVGADLAAARRQVASLADVTDFALADSAFNESELHDWGFARTAVVPILLDVDAMHGQVDQPTVERMSTERKDGAVWLFVGRIAPNKAQHDVIKALAAYRAAFDPKARLHLVGGSSSHRYLTSLQQFVLDLGLGDAVQFCGKVTDAELVAHYRASDVLVCLSDHEGFGVPLVEAMANDLPVVAFASTSVPETLGDAGLLITDKTPATVATSVHRVLEDEVLRSALTARGRARMETFHLRTTSQRLVDVITPLLDETPGNP